MKYQVINMKFEIWNMNYEIWNMKYEIAAGLDRMKLLQSKEMPAQVLYTFLWSVSSFLFFTDNEGVDRDIATDTFEVMEAGGDAIIGDIVE